MKKKNQKLLYKKWFLLAVFLLLINDFFLKYEFHNLLTGKISDFAGLFAFPYFLSLFTKKIKSTYIFTIVFFVFWKTELSQVSIEFLNNLNFNIYRVVDYTDFIALLILPISYTYRIEASQIKIKQNVYVNMTIVLITCFSFIATTQERKPPPHIIEKINLKSGLIINFPFKKETFFDSLGYTKTYMPYYKFNGYYIHVNAENSKSLLYDRIEVLYKVRLKKSTDSLRTQVTIDSILSFSYTKFRYNTTKDSIQKNKLINKYKKMTNKEFDSIFLSKFEVLNRYFLFVKQNPWRRYFNDVRSASR